MSHQLREMLRQIRHWRQAQRQKKAVVDVALKHFQLTQGIEPMRGHLLHLGSQEAIVRVMYLSDRIPPERAWFAVSTDLTAIRQLAFTDVQALESPWR